MYMYKAPSCDHSLLTLILPLIVILRNYEVVFWCMEWAKCTFKKIDENSFNSTSTILWHAQVTFRLEFDSNSWLSFDSSSSDSDGGAPMELEAAAEAPDDDKDAVLSEEDLSDEFHSAGEGEIDGGPPALKDSTVHHDDGMSVDEDNVPPEECNVPRQSELEDDNRKFEGLLIDLSSDIPNRLCTKTRISSWILSRWNWPVWTNKHERTRRNLCGHSEHVTCMAYEDTTWREKGMPQKCPY